MTPLLMKLLFSNSTNTPSLPQENRFLPVFIPFLSSFPIIRHFSNHLSLVYLAILLPFVIQITLTNTRWGLRLIAAGDGPEALVTSGVSLNHTRFVALFLGGCLMAFSGSYLAIGHSSQFIRDMSAGRGFIALAAIIIGKWQPIPTLVACVFFGFTDALQIELQSSEMLNLILPAQFIQSLPYVISLVVLVFAMGRAKPPLAIGQTSR
ncbi:MAG: ABC transporter permease [Proteobacteria bacterium]|nr:ABC transporter permease [Pseudomonadota bacterium]